MFSRGVRCLIVGVAMTGASLATPTESHAIFHWFRRCCPTAAPVAVTNACAPQVVSYVPQTCYRTQYVTVPVTTYVPQTTCSPCAGATTTLRPVTTYVRRPQTVAYTTYRIVYSNPAPVSMVAPAVTAQPTLTQAAPSTPCCGTTGVTAAYGGATMASPSYTSAPSYATTPSYPTTPSYGTTPGASTFAPGYPSTPQPSASYPTNGNGATTQPSLPQTFNGGASPSQNGSSNGSHEAMRPIPDPATQGASSPMGPQLHDPENRTAWNPAREQWSYTPVSAKTWRDPTESSPAAATESVDSGWRASNR